MRTNDTERFYAISTRNSDLFSVSFSARSKIERTTLFNLMARLVKKLTGCKASELCFDVTGYESAPIPQTVTWNVIDGETQESITHISYLVKSELERIYIKKELESILNYNLTGEPLISKVKDLPMPWGEHVIRHGIYMEQVID